MFLYKGEEFDSSKVLSLKLLSRLCFKPNLSFVYFFITPVCQLLLAWTEVNGLMSSRGVSQIIFYLHFRFYTSMYLVFPSSKWHIGVRFILEVFTSFRDYPIVIFVSIISEVSQSLSMCCF